MTNVGGEDIGVDSEEFDLEGEDIENATVDHQSDNQNGEPGTMTVRDPPESKVGVQFRKEYALSLRKPGKGLSMKERFQGSGKE